MPLSTLLLVRARRALARSSVRRGLVVGLALATGLTVASFVRAAETARAGWGDGRPVAVAMRPLEPGDQLDAGAVEVRELPAVAVPPEALRESLDGAIVRQPIAAGEPIIADRLAPAGLTGTAALVPPGHRAMAVPLTPVGAPPLAVGDRVDLLAVAAEAADVPADDDGDPAFLLVEGALVVDVGDDTAAVAVPEADGPRVAFALTQGVVVLALSGE
jgi:Flp pilus assembly protein CpaB